MEVWDVGTRPPNGPNHIECTEGGGGEKSVIWSSVSSLYPLTLAGPTPMKLLKILSPFNPPKKGVVLFIYLFYHQKLFDHSIEQILFALEE